MFSLDPEIKAKIVRDFDEITNLIVKLGSPIVSICGYMPPEIRPQGTELYVGGPPTAVTVADDFSWDKFWENAVDVVSKLAKIAGKRLFITCRFSST